MAEKKKKSTINGKRKGGAFERKIAKDLAIWMFNDPDFIKRHPSSGADKKIWCGDVVPMKQIPDNWKRHFPFVIECKTGYAEHYPTFWKHKQLDIWFEKAYLEGEINNQRIELLICQFKNKSALFMTNYLIDVNKLMFNIAYPVKINESYVYVYCYLYKDILEHNFYELFDLDNILKYICELK